MLNQSAPELIINRFRNPDENASAILLNYVMPNGKVNEAMWRKLNGYLSDMEYAPDVYIMLNNTWYAGLRILLMQNAKSQGDQI